MRILWTLFKIIVGLAIAIPIGIIALGAMFGVVAALIGLAVLALKLAVVAFLGYGAYRVIRRLLWSDPAAPPGPVPSLPSPGRHPDRYYEAAMRELDAELGHSARG